MTVDASEWKVVVASTWCLRGRVACTGKDQAGENRRFIVPAVIGSPRAGEVWRFVGRVLWDPNFGPQMHVESGRLEAPDGRLLIRYLVDNEAFDASRIGMGRASALWNRFGERLFDILEAGDVESLRSCVPESCIQPLIAGWKSQNAELKVVRWLQENGFPLRLARKLLSVYGQDTVAKLESNAYRMLAFCSFAECERAAQAAGIPLDDERRLVAAVQESLYRELASGHTITPAAALCKSVAELLGSEELAEAAVACAAHRRFVFRWPGGIALRGVGCLEAFVTTRLTELLHTGIQRELNAVTDDACQAAIDHFAAHSGFGLNAEQEQAVRLSLTRSLSLVCGGAGVGKTTVLRAIASAMPTGVWFIALTGQAARRMAAATSRRCFTIARFLVSHADEVRKQTAPLIVIDEASMLDLSTSARLLRVLPLGARLLLVGDPCQLPPIGFGLIFHRLVQEPTVPRSELVTVMRQQAETGIPQASHAIRQGIVPSIPVYTGEAHGVFIEHRSKPNILDRLMELKAEIPEAQILCARNAGGVGVSDVNAHFHAIASVGRKRHPALTFAVGDPVIFKRNDASLNLVNGSLGRVTDVDGDKVICDFEGESKIIAEDMLEHLKLAYGITVHSAQGSQFNDVLVVLERSQVVDRTWIYTAVTRSVKRVIIIGDVDVFRTAVHRPPTASNRRVSFNICPHQQCTEVENNDR